MSKHFFERSCIRCGGETIPREVNIDFSLKDQNLAYV